MGCDALAGKVFDECGGRWLGQAEPRAYVPHYLRQGWRCAITFSTDALYAIPLAMPMKHRAPASLRDQKRLTPARVRRILFGGWSVVWLERKGGGADEEHAEENDLRGGFRTPPGGEAMKQ